MQNRPQNLSFLYGPLFVLLFHIPTALARDDISIINLDEPDGYWSIGAGFRPETSPYEVINSTLDFLPIITYNGEQFYIAGTQAGIHLINNDTLRANLYAGYRFGGYDDEDSDFLIDMEREDSVDAGLNVQYYLPVGSLNFDISTDAMSRHNGTEADIGWSNTLQSLALITLARHALAKPKTGRLLLWRRNR